MQQDLELGFEKLEHRLMLAGDVSARISNSGDLVITGDAATNTVIVSKVTVGVSSIVRLTGILGTTVNGGTTIDLAEPTRDLRINMKGGDNRIDLVGMEGRRLSMRSGSGHDFLSLDQGNFSEMRVSSRGGDDLVYVRRSEIGENQVNTGGGDDLVFYTRVSADSSKLSLGSGADTLMSNASEYRDTFSLRAGGGEDAAASYQDDFATDARIDGGGSSDSLLAAWPGGESTINGEFSPLRFESVVMPPTNQAFFDLLVQRGLTHRRYIEL